MQRSSQPDGGRSNRMRRKIIGEGYHVRCGEAHAEVNAIRSVKRPSLLKRSTIYVSLEPCAHYGKNTALRRPYHRKNSRAS